MDKKTKIEVGILLFNDADVLDFTGPFEVFAMAEKNSKKLFNVSTIGETGDLLTACNGFKVEPTHNFVHHPKLDILIIPGGYGAEEVEVKNNTVLKWIKKQYENVVILASVCTGAILLAECNFLDSKKATTHWMFIDELKERYPKVNVVQNQKFVDEGKIITAAGISAGINMSLHIIKRIFDIEVAKTTAKRIEYDIDNQQLQNKTR
ncbi:transcriptional regulator GlxA family with amidase domain [Saonia flava]|uniref:Transcriptional regulator GlxA family with amidase domain n=1 Tax=Saonia flava TaxID=523696 RepID=A0A846QTE4_9FLAO|nr:DJ-1/PfpI family protein [Saonia flava]NJB69613.1 transcriptional regulator GlxA family with amidase domain [Saonia flava]